mmetsp:Transcript_18116/g.54546  ORF Transcript_18116/g.54546 Transcript_18116/m.54546 type:complete len:1319 (+) Transcript_18116:310-4266(+)
MALRWVAVAVAVTLLKLAAGQTTCEMALVGSGVAPTSNTLASSAIRSATVTCTGAAVEFVGVSAMSRFGAAFGGSASFRVSNTAGALLSVSNAELTIAGSSFTNLAIGPNSILQVRGGTITVSDSTFSGNQVTEDGSPLTLNSTDAVIRGSTFASNSADGYGGAITVGGGSLEVSDTSFTSNSAGIGGGAIEFASISGSTATFSNATFNGNTAVCRGGAVDFVAVDRINMTASQITNNTVSEWAGSPDLGGLCSQQLQLGYTSGNGVHAESFVNVALVNTTFDSNGGNGNGGAVFMRDGTTINMREVVVNGNLQDNGNVGGILLVRVVNVIVGDSTFTDNTGPTVGGLQMVQVSRTNITDSTFSGNQGLRTDASDGAGGALGLVSSCTVLCYVANNNFLMNRLASGDGGAVYASSPPNLTMVNNLFDSNSATNTGGAMVVSGSGATNQNNALYVQANRFVNNTVVGTQGSGGALALTNLVSISITSCTMEGNTAGATGGAMWLSGLSNTVMSINNCTFIDNAVSTTGTGSGGAMLVAGGRSLTITDSTFTRNAGTSGGATFVAGVTTTTLTDNVYTGGIGAADSGALHAQEGERLLITRNVFMNNTVNGGFGGAVLLNNEMNTTFVDCNFTNNNAVSVNSVGGIGGCIYVQLGGLVNVLDSTFTRNHADDNSGALYATGIDGIRINGSTFTDSSSPNGGGAVSSANNPLFFASGNTWRTNSGNLGGAVQLLGVNTSAIFIDEDFDSNVAASSGGAVHFAGATTGATLSISNSKVNNNTAQEAGGGVALVGSRDATLTISGTTFSSNQAGRGGSIFGDSNALINLRNVEQTRNSADDTASNNVGCNGCRLNTNGGSTTTLNNAEGIAAIGGAPPGSSTGGTGTNGGGGGGGGLSAGGIAGIVIGVLAGLALAAVAAFFVLRKRKQRSRSDVEVAAKTADSAEHIGAMGIRNKVPSAFAAEGNGSFWSEVRSTPANSTRGPDSHRLGELGFRGIGAEDSDKSGITAHSYGSRSSAPLINTALSGESAGTNRTTTTIPDMEWNDWHIDARDIQVARRDDGREWKLGGGAFGEVYKAMLKGVNPVAVKVLRDQSYTSREEFSREVALLKALHNSNIVQFQGACVEDDKMLLITEFMDGGDLFKAISRKQVTWAMRGKSIAIDVLRGLHFLHSKRIVHMDLKSPNILLSRHGVAKLADVGLAKVIRDRNYITQVSVIGTFAWAAPEVLTNEKCTEKADIFSFGIVLWETASRALPFAGLNGMQAAMAVMNRGLRPEIPRGTPPPLASLMQACWAPAAASRPSFPEIVAALEGMLAAIGGPGDL